MTEEISFEDFRKAELRVAEIVSAERVEGSEKLLKLSLSLGGERKQGSIAKTQSSIPRERRRP